MKWLFPLATLLKTLIKYLKATLATMRAVKLCSKDVFKAMSRELVHTKVKETNYSDYLRNISTIANQMPTQITPHLNKTSAMISEIIKKKILPNPICIPISIRTQSRDPSKNQPATRLLSSTSTLKGNQLFSMTSLSVHFLFMKTLHF